MESIEPVLINDRHVPQRFLESTALYALIIGHSATF